MMRLFGTGRRRSIWFLGVEWVLGIQYNVRNLLLVVHNCMHLYIYTFTMSAVGLRKIMELVYVASGG